MTLETDQARVTSLAEAINGIIDGQQSGIIMAALGVVMVQVAYQAADKDVPNAERYLEAVVRGAKADMVHNIAIGRLR